MRSERHSGFLALSALILSIAVVGCGGGGSTPSAPDDNGTDDNNGDRVPIQGGDIPAQDVDIALEGADIHATALREGDPEHAASEVAAALQGRDEVSQVVVSEDSRCVEVCFADGRYWVYLAPPVDTAEQPRQSQIDSLDVSRFPDTDGPRAAVLHGDFQFPSLSRVFEWAIGRVCPEIGYSVLPTRGMTLGDLDSLSRNPAEFTYINTHGGYLQWLGETMLTTQQPLQRDPQSGKVVAPAGYEADWNAVRIVPGSISTISLTDPHKEYYCVTSAFVRRHCRFANGGMVLVQACHSFDHSDLADACLDKGADVYVGWQGSIYPNEAGERESTLLELLAGRSDSSDTPLNISNAHLQLALDAPNMRYKPDDSEWGLMPHLDEASPDGRLISLDGWFSERPREVMLGAHLGAADEQSLTLTSGNPWTAEALSVDAPLNFVWGEAAVRVKGLWSNTVPICNPTGYWEGELTASPYPRSSRYISATLDAQPSGTSIAFLNHPAFNYDFDVETGRGIFHAQGANGHMDFSEYDGDPGRLTFRFDNDEGRFEGALTLQTRGNDYDHTPPEIVSVYPAPGAAMAAGSTITYQVRFSEQMAVGHSINFGAASPIGGTAEVIYDESTYTYSFPGVRLPIPTDEEDRCTVTVRINERSDSFRDVAGNPVPESSWSFVVHRR